MINSVRPASTLLVAVLATARCVVAAGVPAASLAGGCDAEPSCRGGGGAPLRPLDQPIGLAARSPWELPEMQAADAQHRASYPIETRLGRIVPTVVYVPAPGARMPGLLSVKVERAIAGDPLRLNAELAWSGRPGGGVEVEYRKPQRDASFKLEDRPAGAVALPSGRAPGSSWAGEWTERLGPQVSATLAAGGDRLAFEGRRPEAAVGRVDVRVRTNATWNVFVVIEESIYADAMSRDLRKGVTTLGTEWSAGALGLAATVRDEDIVDVSSGRGGRLTLRGEVGGWQARVYADAQRQATVFQFTGAAGVPRELLDSGFVALGPERVVPLLRDRPLLLARHGMSLGSLRVDPLRRQGGIDLRWRDPAAQRGELGLLLAMDDLQGANAPRRGLLGQVRWSWKAGPKTELTATFAGTSIQGDALREDARAVGLSLRSRI